MYKTPQLYLPIWYKVAKFLRENYDHGAIHLASEQISKQDGNKAIADVHKGGEFSEGIFILYK